MNKPNEFETVCLLTNQFKFNTVQTANLSSIENSDILNVSFVYLFF